jgi:hypothetical protein
VNDDFVHSGLVPSCEQLGEGARVGFAEDVVDCPACRERWRVEGMPLFLVRSGETPEQFRTRTRP